MLHYTSDLRELTGLRADGRRNNEMRKIECKTGINPSADGSSYFKSGITEIICTLQGPQQSQRDSEDLINIEYTVTPFAGMERRKVSKADKEWSEFAENLRVSFEHLICKENYPKSQINILVTVVQADGSTKSAIFNAICLALLDAGIGMKDFMVSCTTGILNYQIATDLTHQEQKQANSEFILSYMPKTNKVIFTELKSSKTTKEDFDQLLELNIEGCKHVYEILKKYIQDNAVKKLICSQ